MYPSIYEFRSHMKNIKHSDRIEESNNDESICKSTAIIQSNNSDDNSNASKIIKMDEWCKVENEDIKRSWDFKKLFYGQFYKSGWKNGSFNHLSLNCSISGFKFGGFAKKYDLYNDSLKQGILTNNGRSDAVMTPKWDWSDWFLITWSKKGLWRLLYQHILRECSKLTNILLC